MYSAYLYFMYFLVMVAGLIVGIVVGLWACNGEERRTHRRSRRRARRCSREKRAERVERDRQNGAAAGGRSLEGRVKAAHRAEEIDRTGTEEKPGRTGIHGLLSRAAGKTGTTDDVENGYGAEEPKGRRGLFGRADEGVSLKDRMVDHGDTYTGFSCAADGEDETEHVKRTRGTQDAAYAYIKRRGDREDREYTED